MKNVKNLSKGSGEFETNVRRVGTHFSCLKLYVLPCTYVLCSVYCTHSLDFNVLYEGEGKKILVGNQQSATGEKCCVKSRCVYKLYCVLTDDARIDCTDM